jgi:hypothetical protein
MEVPSKPRSANSHEADVQQLLAAFFSGHPLAWIKAGQVVTSPS